MDNSLQEIAGSFTLCGMNKKIMSLAVGAFMTAAVLTPIQSNAETICVDGVCELIFDYTGSGQVFDVPNGVTSIDFVVTGAQGARGGKGGEVKLDYRPVHEYTLTDDIKYIEPKARVY